MRHLHGRSARVLGLGLSWRAGNRRRERGQGLGACHTEASCGPRSPADLFLSSLRGLWKMEIPRVALSVWPYRAESWGHAQGQGRQVPGSCACRHSRDRWCVSEYARLPLRGRSSLSNGPLARHGVDVWVVAAVPSLLPSRVGKLCSVCSVWPERLRIRSRRCRSLNVVAHPASTTAA